MNGACSNWSIKVRNPYRLTGRRGDETLMKMPRSKIITKIIIFALIVYAGISLITLRGRVEAVRGELYNVRRAVAEMEIINAQLEYEIEHYNEPEVIADIARSDLGLVLPGEIVFYDGGSVQGGAD